MKSLVFLTGHSQGLGKALAAAFLEKESVEVIGVSRKGSGLNHPQLTEISLDLSDLNQLQEVLPRIFPKRSYERVILVNNAGWIGSIRPLHKQGLQEIQKVHAINYLAPAMLCRQMLSEPAFKDSTKTICNISSGLAYRPEAGLSGYCTSKAALAMLSEVLAKENHPKTRVFSLAPGVIDTPMQTDLRSTDEEDFPMHEKFMNLKSSGSLQSAEDTAKKVLFLLDHPEQFDEVVQDVRKYEIS